MIKKLKTTFNLSDYKKTVGTKTNIHKVSYFFKEDIAEIHQKRILFLDLEFSMKKNIFELGGLILNKGKVEEVIFKEYSLKEGELYYSFEKTGYTDEPINKGKPRFNEKDWLFSLIESVDYLVVHNYPAEAGCFYNLLFSDNYDINKLKCFREGKFICTNYTFKNAYFKKFGLEKTSNSDLSKYFGWNISESTGLYIVENKTLNLKFEVKKPEGVISKVHNSFFDVIITLTNFISAKKILN